RSVKEAFMRIAIIGAGSVGATLGQDWLKHGEDVIWGLRTPADPKYAALPKQRVKAPAESVKEAENSSARDALVRGPSGREKPGQPCGQDRDRLHQSFRHGSRRFAARPRLRHLRWRAGRKLGAGRLRLQDPQRTGASNMARAAEYPVKPLMLVAGDDAAKKAVVMELVGALGFEPVDAGPLKNARLLEPFAMV